MDKQTAVGIIRDTFESPFDKARFVYFIKNLLNKIDETKALHIQGNYVPESFRDCVKTYERIGTYTDPENNKIDVLIVYLQKEKALVHARTAQRNFVARYLKERGEKEAGLVAFVSPDEEDWRFSLVKMDYHLEEGPGGKTKVKSELTPARRWSFLVGKNESSHTAQSQLVPIVQDDAHDPTLKQLEAAFNIEVVTKEFFTKYRELFLNVKKELDGLVEQNAAVKKEFTTKGVNTVDLSKKLLGQIVFLYFLQKKGWLGVPMHKNWGDGDRRFLRHLFETCNSEHKNFLNDYLEYLFYDALNNRDRGGVDPSYYSRFNCKIPFLNGGLFDPINNYDWVHVDIPLINELFSNSQKTKEGDFGTGILDVFDRYNFTVKEDEPLEKEVAIDPEMLGKVFENLLEVKDRKSTGTYYTPREIVHYMCQESLINYLDTAINTGAVPLVQTRPPQGKLFGQPDPEQATLKTSRYRTIIPREEIEELVRKGELVIENEATALQKLSDVEQGKIKSSNYKLMLKPSIRENARLIDDKLNTIRVCDHAVGSGAFLVGMMTEIVRARNVLTDHLEDKERRTNYRFKRHAIQNCLYGVDIDPGAVEIAKLRLWLSLVVDEEDIKQIQPLPNLDYKIVHGNSLMGVEKTLFNLELFKELEKLESLHFDETNVNMKQVYKKQIDQLISQITNNNQNFDFQVYFSKVFRENGGFDVVIANPPYVDGRQLNHNELKDLKQSYLSAQGKVNLFNLFYEKAYYLLAESGFSSLIIPSTFLRNSRYWAIREFILKNMRLLEVIEFDEMQFESSVVENIVIASQKSNPCDNSLLVLDNLVHKSPRVYLQGGFLKEESYRILTTKDVIDSTIIAKIKDGCVTLDSSYFIKDGISTGFKPFPEILLGKRDGDYFISLSGAKEKFNTHVHKRVIDGGEFNRYLAVKWEGRYIKYDKAIEYTPKPPKGKPFNCQLRERVIFATLPRILSRQTSNRLIMTLIQDEFYTRNSIHNIYPRDDSSLSIEYVLSLLNSNLMNYVYSRVTQETGKVLPQVHISDLKHLPIKNISTAAQEPFIRLVNQILAITKDEDYLINPTKQAKVKEYERQIDQMVYDLYELTPEEIVVVEGSHK